MAIALTSAAPPQAQVYVGNFKDNTVSVIDTTTAKVVPRCQCASGPHGMTIYEGREMGLCQWRHSSQSA